ncbi:hypothetical protein DCI98_19230, partial [Salmonella enterica subsp. enterica serovar 4,12:i:-]|nr:hypothetical protein [Salmonella enterica subsp. enterica serovar 4,12:i:-]
MAGVLPATLRAVAAQRVLTDRPQIKQKAPSSDRALRFILCLAVPYSRMGGPHTTIGATAFHFLVRHGGGGGHRAS